MANTTKVILNQTVAKLGVAGDVIEVKSGFARNFLLPKVFAAPWSKKAEEQIELRRAAARRKAIATSEKAEEIKKTLESSVLLVPAKSGKDGKLFGSVKADKIAEAINSNHKLDLSKRIIEIQGVIKATGSATATVHLTDKVQAKLKINVIASAK